MTYTRVWTGSIGTSSLSGRGFAPDGDADPKFAAKTYADSCAKTTNGGDPEYSVKSLRQGGYLAAGKFRGEKIECEV